MKCIVAGLLAILIAGCAGPAGSRTTPTIIPATVNNKPTEYESDGTTYAFFHVRNAVRAMDQRTNELAFELPVGANGSTIRDFQIDRDHRILYALLASSTGAPSFAAIDIRRRVELYEMQLPQSHSYSYGLQLAVGERGNYLYYLESNGGAEAGIIRQISTASRHIVQACKTGHNASAIAADAVRPLLYASWYFSINGAIGVLNTNECRFIKVLPVEPPALSTDPTDPRGGNNSGFRLNRSGTRLYMLSTSGWPINQWGDIYFNRVFVFDTAQRTFIAKPRVYGGPYDTGLAVSPNGAFIIAPDCQYPYSNIINAVTNDDAALIPGNGNEFGFNQSGSRLYEVSDQLRIVDVLRRELIATLPSYGDAPGDFSE